MRVRVVIAVAAAALAVIVVVVGVLVLSNTDEPDAITPDAASTDDSAGGGSEPTEGEVVPGDPGTGGTEPDNPGSEEPPVANDPQPSEPPQSDPLLISVAEARALSPTQLEITYYVGIPECYGQFSAADLAETADAVTVLLRRSPDPTHETPVACIDLAVMGQTTVTLAAPLEGRTLIDGASGMPIPVS